MFTLFARYLHVLVGLLNPFLYFRNLSLLNSMNSSRIHAVTVIMKCFRCFRFIKSLGVCLPKCSL